MGLSALQGGADDAAEAAAWVVRLSQGDPTAAEFDAFEAWLIAEPRRTEAYDRALQAWTQVQEDVALAPEIAAAAPRRNPRPQWLLWSGSGVAAAAAAIAVVVFTAGASPETYETKPGEHRAVALSDGTHVMLNTATRMEVRWSKGERRISLPEGEATFDVAHDANRPFVVRAGDRAVRVLGTEFDVKARGEALAVTVRRGVVEVSDHGGAPVRLLKGDQVAFRQAGAAPSVSHVDPDDVFAWREGRLVYRDATIGEVVHALNLQFGGADISVEPDAAAVRFSGVLTLDSRDQVLHRLTQAAPLAVETHGSAIILKMVKTPAT